MNRIENDRYILVIDDGIIKEFYDKEDKSGVNISGNMNLFGSVGFTLLSDDITSQEDRPNCSPYKDRTSVGKKVFADENSACYCDEEYQINMRYSLDKGLNIEAKTDNPEISQFGVNLELNFLGKRGTPYINQIMPTSPYTSIDNKYMYCIMTRADGRFIVCTAVTECDGWKIDYSPEKSGHYIRNFKFLASFDKVYNGSKRKNVKINIQCAESLKEAYEIISSIYNIPYCYNILGGNFGNNPVIGVSEESEKIEVISPSGKKSVIETKENKICEIPVSEYGFYKVIPYSEGKQGIDSLVWYGKNMKELFDLSTLAIRESYHGDITLCEGYCFLWAMLADMRLEGHLKFDAVARKELSEIMGENGVNIPRKTILPYKTEEFDAYHISGSKRIQEQFFGVSILMEAYKLYKEEEYLEFAVEALNELVKNWITDEGMVFNGQDYTTVCAPVIPVVDMAKLLSELNDERSKLFYDTAIKIAEFLLKRGLRFPTEGMGEDSESDAEDGSVSCTALSVLYVCANLHYDKRYIDFAEGILKVHKAWTIYSPDARMNRSSFRWWETIWEGDGQGPAICAGHAWTIWKAEALYLYGILTCDEEAIVESWNSFITNFSKTTEKGVMYACFEADYIRGGGEEWHKKGLKQLEGEDISVKYKIAHCYPEHCDNSLSRYAWVRNAYSWYNTAALIEYKGKTLGINMELKDGECSLSENITSVFIGKMKGQITVRCDKPVKIITNEEAEVIYGEKNGDYIIPNEGKIILKK